ncbi:MAG: hypothetical protein AAGG38_07845 [Planctomycetota bacterium]
MNFPKPLSVAVLLTAGLILGCEEQPADPADSAASETGDAAKSIYGKSVESAKSVAESVGEAGETMVDKGKEAAAAAADSVSEAVEETVEAGKETIDGLTGGSDTPAVPETPEVPETPQVSAASETDITLNSLNEDTVLNASQADSIFSKVRGLISDGNLELAQQWITKLESVGLPAGYADQLANLKDLMGKAKGAGSLLNGLGK